MEKETNKITLLSILKDSQYNLSIFTPDEITALEKKIIVNDFRGYYNLGVVFHNMGDKENALKQVAKLRELKEDARAEELRQTINSKRIALGKESFLREKGDVLLSMRVSPRTRSLA